MAGRLLDSRGSGDWRFRNMLVFLAPDRSRLEEHRDAVRHWLAWKSIDEEREQLGLDPWGVKQVETKRKQFEEMIAARLGETWQWLLAPSQPADDPTAPMTWEETRLSGPDPIAVRASRRLISEEGCHDHRVQRRAAADGPRSRATRAPITSVSRSSGTTTRSTCTSRGCATRPLWSRPCAMGSPR